MAGYCSSYHRLRVHLLNCKKSISKKSNNTIEREAKGSSQKKEIQMGIVYLK